MGEKTEIAWCHSTFNPWIGCQRVAVGCEHCYAEAFAKRTGKAKWGLQGTRVKTSESYWKQPLKWNRNAQCNCGAAGEGGRECDFCKDGCPRPRVFCASMADVFEQIGSDHVFDHRGERMYRCFAGTENSNDPADNYRVGLPEIRRCLFALIDATPNLDWLLLTKRPENIRRMWKMVVEPLLPDIDPGEWWRQNCWLGTSIATRADAERNISFLCKCRHLAPVLFLSIEPLVEDLGELDLNGINWVIVGCESSGKKAARFQDGYESAARSIIDQCHEAGIPVFHKQMPLGGNVSHDPDEWPSDLRSRDLPGSACNG